MGYNHEAENNDLRYASDLVKFIRQEHGDYFGISVAGYPEGHPDAESYKKDLMYLKEKVDAGADFIITQFFFDCQKFVKYVRDCREIGISCPIIPGILPIFNFNSFKRMINFTKVSIPENILKDLEELKNDDIKVSEYGIKIVIDLCLQLKQNGFNNYHIYTLNRDDCTFKILEGLNMNIINPMLPWRPRVNTNESIRPIFWSNAKDNYLELIKDWDHFPNGRWGDSSKCNFGDIKDYHLFTLSLGSQKNKLKMWKNQLNNLDDVANVFIDFLEGRINYIPWSDNLASETNSIKDQLIELNKKHIFTINSQPRINALSSEHPNGWGPKGGYIYQKAYLEFFIRKDKLDKIIDKMETGYTYCAINMNNNFLTNYDNSINALTWGIFPNNEVIQPTIADTESFKIWKEEAFSFWLIEWGKIYDPESESFQILKKIQQEYYLVFIVDHNFIDGNIFQLF